MAKKNDVLEVIEKRIEVITSKIVDPKEFFQTMNGLYVWSDFKERIVAKAKTIKAKTKYSISSSKLLKHAYDEEIENALPKKHIFTETEVCGLIAELIEKQPNGEMGVLQNNGYSNIFYTPTFVVGLYWGSYDGGWNVGTFDRERGWFDGSRVFSPAT